MVTRPTWGGIDGAHTFPDRERALDGRPAVVRAPLLAYLAGGALTAVGEVRERCAKEIVPASAPLDHLDGGFLPLHWTCVFQDGTTYEGVPSWTNPLVFGALGGIVACVGASTALDRRFRRRSGKPPTVK
ncbi:hypothetical protein [Amycolatopsis saalfeldensis]|uniref:Uncharacterized protein n=1 Tax=Amycolatopsis saalfeldensis TaxID=394193 RepID=A0A1H8YL01_9PSEU|nr:hypothetical protein [Amycolatopsis saalfeldensis]SEP52773.1 hypothetical protein SAMN04489732_12258 [Amycolatopsis saalfeldensis]